MYTIMILYDQDTVTEALLDYLELRQYIVILSRQVSNLRKLASLAPDIMSYFPL